LPKTLVQLQQKHNVQIVVKFHASVFQTTMLMMLSPEEQEFVDLMKDHFIISEEDEFNALPFLEAFDTIIVDLESSIAFETLFFPNKIVLAYDNRERNYETEYKAQFYTFHHAEELENLLNATLIPNDDGITFFQSKYEMVDGNEVEKIFHARGWHKAPEALSCKKKYNTCCVVESINNKIPGLFPDIKVIDLLAIGEELCFDLLHKQVKQHMDQKGKSLENISREDMVDMGTQFDLAPEFLGMVLAHGSTK